MTTRELLAEYTRLLTRYGVGAKEADEFVKRHSNDREFVELATLTSKLKQALSILPTDQNYSTN